MNILVSRPVRQKTGLIVLLLMIMACHAFAQDSCDCPSINQCAPCKDGLTTLVLKYPDTQSATVNISIEDQQATIFQDMVDPGDTIVINGSPPNGKFVGNKLTIRENNVVKATLNTSCSQPVYLRSVIADFIVIGGRSKAGGEICCDPSKVEHVPPVISQCPSDIRMDLPEGTCSAVVTWPEPSASDNCEVLSFTNSHAPGESFSAGTTEVLYTAIDKFGTSTTCTFNIFLSEPVEPTLANCPSDISLTAGTIGAAEANWSPPTAADNCSEVSLVSTHDPGAVFPIGTTDVTYEATDASGNTSTCTFRVMVSPGQVDVDFQKVLTPDGDGVNDKWMLLNIEHYSNNNVTIVDRWGSVVYAATGYDNENIVWKGQNTSGTTVPTGTYFYAVKVSTGTGTIEKKGFIELIRSR